VVLAMVALWVALPLEYRRRPSEPDAG
jgi:hypothetical protein